MYITNARRPNSTFGGLVQGCNPACPAANMMQFNTAGQLVAYYPGVTGATNAAGQATAGSSNFNSGGDGAYDPYGDVFDGYHQGTMFSRFSYDLTDNIDFYVQGQASREGGGFSGAGLRDAQHVPALKGLGNGLRLDRSWRVVARRIDGVEHLFAQAEFVKVHFFSHCATVGIRAGGVKASWAARPNAGPWREFDIRHAWARSASPTPRRSLPSLSAFCT